MKFIIYIHTLFPDKSNLLFTAPFCFLIINQFHYLANVASSQALYLNSVYTTLFCSMEGVNQSPESQQTYAVGMKGFGIL